MRVTKKFQSHTHIYFIVVGLLLLIISGSFLTEGMSLVGLENGINARGIYSAGHYVDFWLPSMTVGEGSLTSHAYMPLGYYLENWVMKLVGDSYIFDKLYSMVLFIICLLLIVRIWVLVGNSRRTGWLPILFWMLAPVVTRTATDNLLETPLTIFVLMSVCSLLHGYKVRREARKYAEEHPDKPRPWLRYLYSFLWAIMSSIWMSVAFMVKGFSGLYTAAMPLIFWLFGQHEKILYPIIDTLLIVATWVGGGALLIWLTPGVQPAVKGYVRHQFMDGMLYGQTVSSHFFILNELVLQMLVPVIVLVVVSIVRLRKNHYAQYVLYWRHKEKLSSDDLRNSRLTWRFFCLGMAGVVPILFTLKQQDYYLVSMLPMFAISSACFVNNIAVARMSAIKPVANQILSTIAIIVMTTAIVLNLSSISKVTKDADLINDMHQILPLLQEGEVVSVTPELAADHTAASYYMRYKSITFDTALTHEHMMSLFSDVKRLNIPTSYIKVKLPTKLYHVYRAVPKLEQLADSLATVERIAAKNKADSIKAEQLRPHLNMDEE